MGSTLALLHATTGTGIDSLSYSDIIRKIIKVGGCNCSRANIVGAYLGACYGFEACDVSGKGACAYVFIVIIMIYIGSVFKYGLLMYGYVYYCVNDNLSYNIH